MLDLTKPIRIKGADVVVKVERRVDGVFPLVCEIPPDVIEYYSGEHVFTEDGFYWSDESDHSLQLENVPDEVSPPPITAESVTVGDLTSTSRGTGARKAAGKPDLSQLPWWAVDRLLAVETGAPTYDDEGQTLDREGLRWQVLTSLAWWARGVDAQLDRAFKLALRLLAAEQGQLSVSPRSIIPCVRVLEFGAGKYSRGNWAKGMPWSVCFNSAMSHLTKALAGDAKDEESGLSHEAHLMCNIVFLLGYRELYPEGDDRIQEFKFPGDSDIPF